MLPAAPRQLKECIADPTLAAMDARAPLVDVAEPSPERCEETAQPNPVEPSSARDLPLQSAKVELSPERTPSPDVCTEPAAAVVGEQEEEVCSPVTPPQPAASAESASARAAPAARGVRLVPPGSSSRHRAGPPAAFARGAETAAQESSTGQAAGQALYGQARTPPNPESKRSQYREAFGVKRTSSGKWKNPRHTQP